MRKLFSRKEKAPVEEYYNWDDIEIDDEQESQESCEEAYYAEEEGEDPEGYYAEAEGGLEEGSYYAEEESGEGLEGYYAEAEDGLEEGSYYAEAEDGLEEGSYYAEEESYEGLEGYYAEAEDGLEEGSYYAEDGSCEEPETYYAEEESYEEAEAYYAEDGSLEEDGYYAESENYEEEIYYAEEEPVSKESNKKNIFALWWQKFLDLGTMDRIVVSTGVAVLILALVTGCVYVSATMVDRQASAFVSVGSQLDGIELIGSEGLMAVADAQKARLEAAEIVEEQTTEYDETDYSKVVTVELEMVSIQKDLKIKFTNDATGKLIPNVPFSVTVTDPDNNTLTWYDDDMDGIIYQKGITPGTYKVEVNALTDEKYKDYILPVARESVEVKAELDYKKVDVSNEIKSESEIDASLEDTKINEIAVESTLQDTVQWVESSVTATTYVEVAKSTIPDPTTLVATGNFMRTATYTATISESSKTLRVGDSFTLTASCQGVNLSQVTWSNSNPSVVKIEPNGASVKVTALGNGQATISFTASGTTVTSGDAVNNLTGTCMVNASETANTMGTVTMNTSAVNVAVGAQTSVKANAASFTAGRELAYTVTSSNQSVATATVDGAGNVSINGVAAGNAVITVKVNYKDGNANEAVSAQVNVTVTTGSVLTLDSTAATVFLSSPVTVNATIADTNTGGTLTAVSSDTNVATVAVNDKAVTITGVNVGSATITVKYVQNGVETVATCAVTVKGHPKDDRTTQLKDANGVQLYVLEGETYREAVYADYYTSTQFFIKGEAKYTGWQTLDGKVYFFDAAGRKVTGEQVIQGAKYNFASDGSLVTGSGTMGIDVSKWNGNIDWNAVKNSGVSYVIIRCGYRGSSQGALIEDPKFRANIQGATAAGLKVGVYFFTQAVDEVEAIEEASMVLDMVRNYRIS